MKLKRWLCVAAILGCSTLVVPAAHAQVTGPPVAVATPTSGPPGLIVTVSDFDGSRCTGPATLTWGDGLAEPFTPPSGATTVPDLPPGLVFVHVSCDGNANAVAFDVQGAVAATPVEVAPAFTG